MPPESAGDRGSPTRRAFLAAGGAAAVTASLGPLGCLPKPGAGPAIASADVPPARKAGVPAPDVEALLAQMTLDEKIGQMTQVDKTALKDGKEVHDFFIGSVLSGADSLPKPNEPATWLTMTDGYQSQALATRLGIPLVYGVDAVHGNANVLGATVFPHNLGLGATRDPALVERIGRATAMQGPNVQSTPVPATSTAVTRAAAWTSSALRVQPMPM